MGEGDNVLRTPTDGEDGYILRTSSQFTDPLLKVALLYGCVRALWPVLTVRRHV